jgi:hypothetical protein
LNERQGIVWGTVGVIYLFAILWGGTHALRTWWGVLLLGALIAIGVAALRRQSLTEFPSGAMTPAIAGHEPAAPLEHLDKLQDAGAISDDEPAPAEKPALE